MITESNHIIRSSHILILSDFLVTTLLFFIVKVYSLDLNIRNFCIKFL